MNPSVSSARPVDNGPFAPSGGTFFYVNLIGDPYAGTSAPDRFINLSAFKVPCTLDPDGDGSAGACIPGTWHFGSLGRTALCGPGYQNVNFSIFKDPQITEKLRIQLRAEVFNIFNHPNFSNPLLPSFAADITSSIDEDTGRGTGFLPITVTPDVGIGYPFMAVDQETFSSR